MSRKAKPTTVYREEVTYEAYLRRFNSTRQTFDRDKFDSWRECDRSHSTDGVARRYFVGAITWREEP